MNSELYQEFTKLNARFDTIEQTMATKADVKGAVEELARIIATTVSEPMERHFNELKDFKTVREEVITLKADMQKIKEALHLI
jgi:hypothetical protein